MENWFDYLVWAKLVQKSRRCSDVLMSPETSSGGTKGMANCKKISSPCATPNEPNVETSRQQFINNYLPYSTVMLEENSMGKVSRPRWAYKYGYTGAELYRVWSFTVSIWHLKNKPSEIIYKKIKIEAWIIKLLKIEIEFDKMAFFNC